MRRRNFALACGIVLALPLLVVALFGQSLAPRNPTDFNYVAEVGARFVAPPFLPFVAAEFPLGSDSYGRDTLSRLLWAVRPTLMLVFGIGLLRVVFGVLIGAAAGWSQGHGGRMLGAVTSSALTLPVFLVALLVIAALSERVGAAAFVLGLTLTGWAEVAQYCADQVRIIRHERFIEAARALGSSDWQIMQRHVWRQLLPVLRLFFVVEMSEALLAIASLGFLGYFAGGTNWIMITDFEAQRLAGTPDLSEMLASAVQSRDTAQMLIVGIAVVLVVLCFQLMGEGIRMRLALERRHRGAAARAVTDFVQSQQDRLAELLDRRRARVQILIVSGAAVAALAGVFAAQMLVEKRVALPLPQPVAGGHLWASARRDAAGSRRAAGSFVPGAPRIVWERQWDDELSGVAVGRDGVIYVTAGGRAGRIHALEADGRVRWSASLDEAPIGAPGLSVHGDVLVADEAGGLTAFDVTGARRWHTVIDADRRAIAGPVLDDDGNAYVALDGALGSVDADGDLRWRAQLPYAYFSPALRVSDGFVFFKDIVFSARSGAVLLKESRDDLDQFVTGADGRLYLLSQAAMLLWQREGDGVSLVRVAQMDWTKDFPGRNAFDAVVWFDGSIWLQIPSGFSSVRMAWLDQTGALRGSIALPYGHASVIAIDEAGVQALCGESSNVRVRCDALPANAREPAWSLEFDVEPVVGDRFENAMIVGGALAGDRLIVAARTGKLVVIGW